MAEPPVEISRSRHDILNSEGHLTLVMIMREGLSKDRSNLRVVIVAESRFVRHLPAKMLLENFARHLKKG